MSNNKDSTEQAKLPPADRKSSPGRFSTRRGEKYHERIESMFTDINSENDQECDAAETHLKQSALRNRLLELEIQVPDSVDASTPPAVQAQKHAASPILYERDRMGYVYSEDLLQEIHDAGTLAHGIPSVSAPLTASGEPIGEVQLTSPEDQQLTPEAAGLVNAVAQQASLQIQNLRLLAETERARAEAETATRHFMHEAWDSYLDGINQNERIGYAYDQASVAPFLGQPEDGDAIRESVNVLEEQVGALYLKPDPAHPLEEGGKEMIAAVANQIAQQVENIRLLADASRARAEADAITKRLTRENWDSFVNRADEKFLGFIYDNNQVSPMGDRALEDVALTIPLQVRGETIGRLAVAGTPQVSAEAASMAAAIAAQASTHLEALRLNEELQQRAAELLELDRLKSGFLANMSHELRTPLNSILGFSDVIIDGLDGPLTENMDNDLRLIQKNGQHLLHLINDVLDMAKIEAGRMNLNPESVRIHDILDEVTSITSSLATEKKLSLIIEPDSDQMVEIFADRTRIQQVMINLVNNGIKFTEMGSISIRAVKKDASRILITVKDTGIGIPPEKLELIFQEFTQVDTSSTRKAGGTGLGLPISRRLVEMHGGRLWAESTGISGEGSTLFVELPLVARLVDVIEKKEK